MVIRAARRRLVRRLGHAGMVAVLGAALTLQGCAPSTSPTQPAADLRRYDVGDAAVITQGPATIGFADSDLYNVPTDRMGAAIAQMKSLGAGSIRIMLPWAGVERQPGSYDWRVVDAMVDSAVAQQMSVLATLNSTPTWAGLAGSPPISGRPASADLFGRFAGLVAKHFRGRVSAYEIWNEPNSASFFAPTPNAGQYTALLKAAYPAIKANDPSAVVVTGGLGPLVDSGAVATDAVEFLRDMYAAGARGNFDAVGYHPYQYTMKFSEGGYHPDSPINQLAGIHRLMLTKGDGAKKVWATEYGEPAAVAGERGQAAYLDDMLRKWRTIPYAGPVYVYSVRDRDSRSTHPEDTLGIYRSDGTAKLAARVLRSRATQRGVLVQQPISAPR